MMEWIPFKDRLPEEGLIVLASSSNSSDVFFYWIKAANCLEPRATFMNSDGWGFDYSMNQEDWCIYEEKITHWMPLPEPPKDK